MIVSRSIVFHEIGHVCGYYLANRHPETFLGDYRLVFAEKNCVEALSRIYVTESKSHFENCQSLYSASMNIRRTVAYMIKTMLGCVFQSVIESCVFDDLWQLGKSGEKDLKNLYSMRTSYAFRWDDKDISSMQEHLKCILIDNNVLAKMIPLLEMIEAVLQNVQSYTYEGKSLDELNYRIQHILENVEAQYDFVLNYWEMEFSNRIQDNPCSMLYSVLV